MKKTTKFIKSAEDFDLEDQDQFEVDEEMIDSISDSEEFAGEDVSKEDIIEAIQAIDALADSVLEKSDSEDTPVDADSLLDAVEAMIEAPAEDVEEFEMEEDEELPEELTNAAVKVMISEDGATTVESNPDSVYDTEIDGLDCTVFDTCDDIPMEIEDEGESDDLLVVGSSKATKFKKGFVTLKSSANKKVWSAAVKKVRKMVKSNKLTAAHWAIVSALAAKMEALESSKKAIQSKVINVIKNNADMKKKLSMLLKSDAEFDNASQPENETKPEDVAGTEVRYTDEGDPAKETSPEEVESTSGNSVEDPKTDEETEGEFIDVPTAPIAELDVPMMNACLKLKKLSSSKHSGKTMYIVNGVTKSTADKITFKAVKSSECKQLDNAKEIKSKFDGKVVNLKNGLAVAFKETTQGLMACVAAYENKGKGNYTVCLKNNKYVITTGVAAPVFSTAEKVIIAQKIASARAEGEKKGREDARKLFQSRIAKIEADAKKQIASAKHLASAGERRLQQIHAAEERERLFQSSQREMNAEKAFIKENNTRNQEALNALYSKMF